MNRKSSFDPSPPTTRSRVNHGFEPFPLFEPIRDGNSLSQRLSLAGIDVNKYHVQALRVPSGNDVHSGHQSSHPHNFQQVNKSASSSRSNSGSGNSSRQQHHENWGPRYSQVTLSRHDEPKFNVTDVYRNPIVSSVIQQTPAVRQQIQFPEPSLVANSCTRKSSIEDGGGVDCNRNDTNDNDLDDSFRGNICRRDSSTRRRPSSVEDEMNGKGFKNWARSHSRLYTKNPRTTGASAQIFNKQFVKGNRGIDSTMPDREVKLQYHMRRLSAANGGTNALKNRRTSIMTTIFGESGNRRFSEDLRASIKPSNFDPNDEDSEGYQISVEHETAKVIFFQVFIPFLIAGFGNVAAGLILDFTQHWAVFRATPELFVLIASFIGFKGNLEMTLAARLSTITNLGEMDTTKAQIRVAIGNVCLVQGQAIVLAFLAAAIAIAISYFKEFIFEPESWLLILTTSLVTASFTGFVLPVLTVIVTILSRKAAINPDNVSTLTTAFLGDLSAVVMLCYSARFFFHYRPVVWLEPCVILLLAALLPICLYTARQNEYTRDIVGNGWIPIIIAMVISSFAGLIFDFAVQKYQTIAVFQPIINGVGSNLVAVHASRISTYLHLRCKLGSLPVDEDGHANESCQSPWSAFFGESKFHMTRRLINHIVTFSFLFCTRSKC